MRLYFTGHDYKYAAEQMLLTLFPEQRPEYPEGKPDSDRIELKLSHGDKFTTASCRMVLGGKVYHGRAAVRRELLTSELLTDRYCQRLIKNAMYRAALASGVHRPAWGALTGVRPGKIFCSLLAAGLSEDEATRRFIDEYDVTPKRAALCRDTSRETVKAVSELGEKDVCLYVGIPFCPTRCAYCSFVSQSVEKSMKLIPPFMDALIKEVSAVGAELCALGLRVVSIYMGGGTPTTLNAAQLDRLCTALEREFDLGALREYTVEAGRPDTITEDKLRVLRAHGVDRVHDLLIRLHRSAPYSYIASAAPAALDDIALLRSKARRDDIVYLARNAAHRLRQLVALYLDRSAVSEHLEYHARYLTAQAHLRHLFSVFDFL